MHLQSFISQHSLQDIIQIEHSDPQFLAIKKGRDYISTTERTHHGVSQQSAYLYLILQTALISYQISGSWELWREEITERIATDFEYLHERLSNWLSNVDRRYQTLNTSKYNKRIYNIKRSRLDKFFESYHDHFHIKNNNYINFHQDMNWLLSIISKTMKQPDNAKTITFAIKIFGYGARIVFDQLIHYPMNIKIPVDSRLIKIASLNNKHKMTNSEIQNRFQSISESHNIAPLHLDSLIRIKYRNLLKTQ